MNIFLRPRFSVRPISIRFKSTLQYVEGGFKSVEVNEKQLLSMSPSTFSAQIPLLLDELRKLDKSAVYLTFTMDNMSLVPIAKQHGFRFHHAEGDVAKLLLWLPNTECKVPPFATHHCGVGAVVIDGDKILLVREKSKITGWKLPGGYVNLGEDFSSAAVREVFEETGIKSEFVNLISFRHSHNIQFGRGDVYLICRLKPVTKDIFIDDEIDDAKWMIIKDFAAGNKHQMLAKILDLIINDAPGLNEAVMSSPVPGRPPFKMYLPN